MAGDRIIFSPGREPRNGDIVVVRLRETDGVMVKCHHPKGPDVVLLESSNSAHYPLLEYQRKVLRYIWPAIEIQRRLRRA